MTLFCSIFSSFIETFLQSFFAPFESSTKFSKLCKLFFAGTGQKSKVFQKVFRISAVPEIKMNFS